MQGRVKGRPLGITALSCFFVFGAVMSGLTAVMLLVPGTPLDHLWRFNPRAHEGFVAMGRAAVLLMIVVCVACSTSAVGLWRCMRWGYWTALAILVINLIGDSANVFIARDWRTLIGIPVGGLMIYYLFRRRDAFS